MVRRPSTRRMSRNSREPLLEEGQMDMDGIFDSFEGYQEDWPGVYSQAPKPAPEPIKLDVFETLNQRRKWTPDFKKLRMHKNILVFAHDGLVFLGQQHKYMTDAKYLGKAVSIHDSYTMKGHRFPVLMENYNPKNERAKIKGEIYAVTPERMLVLDRLKYNGVMFRRELRTFFLKDQKFPTKAGTRVPSVKAWVYLGVPDVWHGDHLPTFPRYAYAGLKDKMYYEYFPQSNYPPRPQSTWDFADCPVG